jgi:hypothetical protein
MHMHRGLCTRAVPCTVLLGPHTRAPRAAKCGAGQGGVESSGVDVESRRDSRMCSAHGPHGTVVVYGPVPSCFLNAPRARRDARGAARSANRNVAVVGCPMERHGGARDNTTQHSPRPDRPAARRGRRPGGPGHGTADSTGHPDRTHTAVYIPLVLERTDSTGLSPTRSEH